MKFIFINIKYEEYIKDWEINLGTSEITLDFVTWTGLMGRPVKEIEVFED